jgi:hypothetical protein
MDVHANTISAGLLEPGWDSPVVDKMSADDESVRRLVGRFEDPGRVWACYEAGPTGYELARLLRSAGMRCEVIAPSLIPTAPGQRVKTDQRDARRLALLFRAGQLSAVRVPAPAEEAVRDLCRARADMVIDRTRARHRLGKFLLRHGRVWRGGDNWTLRHDAWIRSQRFDQRALTETFCHYLATLEAREAAVEAIEADLRPWCERAPVRRRRAPSGRLPRHHRAGGADAVLGGVRLAPLPGRVDVHGLHRAGPLRALQRGAGEPGRHHPRRQHPPAHAAGRVGVGLQVPAQLGATLRKRHEGLEAEVVARAWAAQLRLCGKFRRLDARKTNRKVVVTAIARELAGFVWAEMARN